MKYTSDKAWMGALTTVLAVLFALFGIGEMPSPEDFTSAIEVLGTLVVSGLVSFAAVWFKANREKK